MNLIVPQKPSQLIKSIALRRSSVQYFVVKYNLLWSVLQCTTESSKSPRPGFGVFLPRNSVKNGYLTDTVTEFIEKKMVFIGGPRQVGKTTLCLRILESPKASNPYYLSWDDLADRKNLREGFLPIGPQVVLDEIHKFKN
ncbi:hypothetical protein EBU99_13265 [bacterium]|nr:hypothetical protein [bacterium]